MPETRLTIAILIEDEDYLQMLLCFVRHSDFANTLHVRAFSYMPSKESLTGIDLLLVCEEAQFRADRVEGRFPVIVLSSQRTAELAEGRIFRYLPLSELFQSLINFLSENRIKCEPKIEREEPEILGFFSIAGGVGKSTVSLTLAKKLGSQGSKVFYLNLEEVPSLTIIDEANQGTLDFSQFIYEMNKPDFDASDVSERMQVIHDVHCLRQQVLFRELEDLDVKQISLFLDSLRKFKYFDYILLDLPNRLSPFVISCLLACQSVCWLLTDERTHFSRIRLFLNFINQMENREQWSWLNHAKFVLNKYHGYILNDSDLSEIEISALIPLITRQPEKMNEDDVMEDVSFVDAVMKWFERRVAG